MAVQLSAAQRGPAFRLRESTWLGLRLAQQANPGLMWTLAATTVIIGCIPTAFTLAGGGLVAVAQDADRSGGFGGATMTYFVLILLVVAVLSVANDAGQRFQAAWLSSFERMVEGRRRERVMAAALAPRSIAHLDGQESLDLIRHAARPEWAHAGHFASGVFGMLRTRVMGVSAALVIGQFRWWLAVTLLAIWLWTGRSLRLGQTEAWDDTSAGLRRSSYYRDLAFQPLAAKEVRIFGLSDWLLATYSDTWLAVMREVWIRRRARRWRQAGLLLVVLAVNGWAFVYIANAVASGDLSVAGAAVVVPAVTNLAAVGEMNWSTMSVTLGAVSLPSLVQLETETGRIAATTPGTEAADFLPRREIVFEDVGFAYPTRDEPVYEHLDLRIEAGKSLAIVGVNGAGKTTFVKLLARLYEPPSGRITVDGIDLTSIDPAAWQARLAAIFQDFVRFEMSAADNVRFGAPTSSATHDAVVAAAKRVGADAMVDALPDGWDTVLSRRFEGGMDLSGGQWQRLALARALFALDAGAGVLILDEPTASLDVRGEVEIFDRFLEVTRGATSVVISHRFSTVRRADRIVVIDEGRVVEDGTHAELLALGGRYARGFSLQAERYGYGHLAPGGVDV